MKIFFQLLFCVIFFCLSFKGQAQATSNKQAAQQLTYKIIASENNTWGYSIYRNEKLFVHQPHIPGMQGNGGFKTKSAAETVAKEVIKKIEKGEMPPTITTDELKKLKVI